MGLYYWNGKPLFVDGKVAFSRACCCNLPCSRVVYVFGIGVSAPYFTEPGDPPLRTGVGGNSYLMYYAESKDTYSAGPAGQNYWNKVWAIEFCWNAFDVLDGDQLSPEVSYTNELLNWSCDAYKAWVNASTCSPLIFELDDPYDQNSYTGTGGVDDQFLNMDSLVGVGNWIKIPHVGPVLTSNCPDCVCTTSCEPDGT